MGYAGTPLIQLGSQLIDLNATPDVFSAFCLLGYFSTTARLKDAPTALQAALALVTDLKSLEILEKLCYNVACCPQEAKYRRVKLNNPKIKASIGDVPEALEVLCTQLGWERSVDETDGEILVLPVKAAISMHQVRDIQAAQQELKVKERDLKRSASMTKLNANADSARIRAQLEADKLERSAAAGKV
jgi:hypothetical protein